MWWLWRSWLARQIVALEAVGSSPTSHPTLQGKRTRKSSLFSINKLGCRQAVRHGTLTPACAGSNPANPTTPPQAVHRLRRLFCKKAAVVLTCAAAPFPRETLLAQTFGGAPPGPWQGEISILTALCKNRRAPSGACTCQAKVDTEKQFRGSPVQTCTERGFYSPKRRQVDHD